MVVAALDRRRESCAGDRAIVGAVDRRMACSSALVLAMYSLGKGLLCCRVNVVETMSAFELPARPFTSLGTGWLFEPNDCDLGQ